MRLREVEQDQVGVHAELDHAALGLAPLRARAADRRHHQRRLRRQRLRAERVDLGQQRGGLDLLKHIEVVVRDVRVRAEGDVHPGPDHLLDLGDAGGQLHVGDGVVHRAHAALGQQLHVVRLEPDAVRRARRAVKNVVAVKELRRGQTVALLALLVLELRLGEVDVHPQPLALAVFAQRLPETVVRGILAVDGCVDADAAVVIAVPFFLDGDQLLAGGVRVEAEFLAEERRAAGDVGLDAALCDGLADLVAEGVHIRDGRRAEAQALGQRQQRRGLHAAAVEALLGREDVVLEPRLQLGVVGEAAHRRHGQMGVAVDEAGHEHHALAVDDLLRLFLGSLAGEIADLAVRHADKGRKQHAQVFVHRYDRDVGKKCVHCIDPFLYVYFCGSAEQFGRRLRRRRRLMVLSGSGARRPAPSAPARRPDAPDTAGEISGCGSARASRRAG